MHELSICHSIAKIVAGHAAERPVRGVHLRIGELRQIVPETLVYCWSMTSAGTSLDGSQLHIESVPATIRCRQCEHETILRDPVLICGSCESAETTVVAGEEFLITSLEVAEVD